MERFGKKTGLKHKFHARPTKKNNIHFDSKKEAQYYEKLNILKKSGEILFFLRQVPFDLPGGVKYRLDFLEFWANGEIVFTEVKGFMTKQAKDKIKMVEDLYNIEINIA